MQKNIIIDPRSKIGYGSTMSNKKVILFGIVFTLHYLCGVIQ